MRVLCDIQNKRSETKHLYFKTNTVKIWQGHAATPKTDYPGPCLWKIHDAKGYCGCKWGNGGCAIDRQRKHRGKSQQERRCHLVFWAANNIGLTPLEARLGWFVSLIEGTWSWYWLGYSNNIALKVHCKKLHCNTNKCSGCIIISKQYVINCSSYERVSHFMLKLYCSWIFRNYPSRCKPKIVGHEAIYSKWQTQNPLLSNPQPKSDSLKI